MKVKIKNILWGVGITLFLVIFILNSVERAMVLSNGTDDYMELRDEYISPDEIQAVIYDDDAELIYVGYKMSPCVNVYTCEGEFLWCVMTEYLGPCYYDVIDKSLIIYSTETAYTYDSKKGSFVDKSEADTLELSYQYQGNYVSAEDINEGDICYDKHQVYVMSSVGSLNEIVVRPDWYALFDYSWVAGIIGVLLIIIVSTMSTIENRRKNRE